MRYFSKLKRTEEKHVHISCIVGDTLYSSKNNYISNWFKYLSHFATIFKIFIETAACTGVPQGSILGPLFIIFLHAPAGVYIRHRLTSDYTQYEQDAHHQADHQSNIPAGLSNQHALGLGEGTVVGLWGHRQEVAHERVDVYGLQTAHSIIPTEAGPSRG